MDNNFIPDSDFIIDDPERSPSSARAKLAAKSIAENIIQKSIEPKKQQQQSDFIPDDQFVSDEDKHGTGLEQFKTFAQKAAEAATFGLSTQALAKSGLADVQAMKAREEVNPESATAGELAGIAGSLLIPGAAELTPVGRLAKAAEATSKAVEPTVGRLVSRIADPSIAPRVNKILSKAGSAAIGSALEGGVYGLGKSISEDALGDHGFNAESLLSNIGLSSLYGGVAGGAVGGILGALEKPIVAEKTVKDALDDIGVEQSNNFVDTILHGSDDTSKKLGIIEGLKKQKGNVKEIQQAANDLGVPVFVGQVSDSGTVQKAWSTISSHSASHLGVEESAKVASAFNTVEKQVGDALGGMAAQQSKAELGESLATTITGKLDNALKPIKELYKMVAEKSQKLDLFDDEKIKILEAMQDLMNKNHFHPESPQGKFISQQMDVLTNLKTYRHLDDYLKTIYKNTPNDFKWVGSALRSTVEDSADNILIDFADGVGAADVTGEIAAQITAARAAKPMYKKLITQMKDLSGILGKKNIHGPEDFFDFVRDVQTPEKIADKLFQKENSRFVKRFQASFPEEWEAIKRYQKGKIFDDALKDGKININKALSKVEKMEPELKKALFTDKELKTFNDARTWIDAFPAKFNPSETDMARSFKSFFENPMEAVKQTARDVVFKKGFEKLGLSSAEKNKFQLLQKVERSKIKMDLNVKDGIKTIFTIGDKTVKAKVPESLSDNDDKIKDKITEYANNPSLFLDEMDKRTQNLYQNAPGVAASFHEAASKATMYLYGKLPKVPEKKPLGRPYKISQADIAKFNKSLIAIHNPTIILEQIISGTVSRDSFDAVKTVYPAIFSKMQHEALNHITDADEDKIKKMPYRIKLGLSMLLGSDLAVGMGSQSIIANQSKFTNNQREDNKMKVTQKGLQSLKVSENLLTPMQRSERKS